MGATIGAILAAKGVQLVLPARSVEPVIWHLEANETLALMRFVALLNGEDFPYEHLHRRCQQQAIAATRVVTLDILAAVISEAVSDGTLAA